MGSIIVRALYLTLGVTLGATYTGFKQNQVLSSLNNSCVRLATSSFYNGCVEGKFETIQETPATCENMTKSWYESIKPILPLHDETVKYKFNYRREQ